MMLKFCGMMRQSDLDMAASLKSDFCGFIFHKKSPRYIDPEQAAGLESHDMKRVGVFVNQDATSITEIARIAKLDLVQLHGDYAIEDARKIGKERVIKALWPQRHPWKVFLKYALEWAKYSAYLLLDSGAQGGGSGKTLPWVQLENLDLPVPWFLAGGLAPENLRNALRACNPSGVDINSGVEKAPGQKNHLRMNEIKEIIFQGYI